MREDGLQGNQRVGPRVGARDDGRRARRRVEVGQVDVRDVPLLAHGRGVGLGMT